MGAIELKANPSGRRGGLALLTTIRRGWGQIPIGIRSVARKTGVSYAANYLATRRVLHHRDRFAGNLASLSERNDDRMEQIFESIVLPNGVRKTTAPGRQSNTLRHFLSRPERPVDGANVRVLDLPSSSGVGSIASRELLRAHYNITEYVLADLCLEVMHDRQRGALYTADGKLLQVQGTKRFTSVYRAHSAGTGHTLLSDVLLWPLSVRAAWLKWRCAPKPENLESIRLLHPETERRVAQGDFTVKNADVFGLPWQEEFDLVLSFNLLQRNYFPPAKIQLGLQNLCRALRPGGYLVTGNTESFGVMRRIEGRLETQYECGQW